MFQEVTKYKLLAEDKCIQLVSMVNFVLFHTCKSQSGCDNLLPFVANNGVN